jgi:hypothetical protein
VTATLPAAAPERLETGELGPVLRTANREYEADIDEGEAFRRLGLRLERPARVRRGKLVLALAFAGALALSLKLALAPPVAPSISAEAIWSGKGTRVSRPAPAVIPRRDEVLASPRGSAKASAPTAQRSAAQLPRVERSRQVGPAEHAARDARVDAPAPALPSAANAVPPVMPERVGTDDGPDCLSLARGGAARDAEACFLRRAEGSGLGAEMALYEVARLRRDVLADESGALAALATYRSRFSGGSLRREVDMLQLELLIEVGRTADALRESAALLTSSAAGKRAAELRLWRGHIFRQKLGDLRAAEREYALAEQAEGTRRVDASYFRGLCLHALGDDAAAALAYERYLEQRGQSHANDARKRLEELRR